MCRTQGDCVNALVRTILNDFFFKEREGGKKRESSGEL